MTEPVVVVDTGNIFYQLIHVVCVMKSIMDGNGTQLCWQGQEAEVMNKSFCMAPWVHTFCSPQGERRMCCASREPTQNFKQYIDSETTKNEKFNPLTLEDHWNSDHMKDVRKRMLAGETLPECEVCNKKLLNTDVYRDYFNGHFGYLRSSALKETVDGFYTQLPISYDYRLSNLCNFKCRMCGPQLSSQWEAESRKHNLHNEPWMEKNVRATIEDFQNDVVKQELKQAIENKTIREIYWCGGEPLMWDTHWEFMLRIIELGYADEVLIRYNTNLSNIYQPTTAGTLTLFSGILQNFKNWQICASIDGLGQIGEYIRTGFQSSKFIDNFKIGQVRGLTGEMKLDLTVTLPGLFGLKEMFNLSKELNAELLTKICFSFSPRTVMSPLILPRYLLEEIVDNVLESCEEHAGPKQRAFINTLTHLKEMPTFQEQFGLDEANDALIAGKKELDRLDKIRREEGVLNSIFKQHNTKVYDWWENINVAN